MANPTPLLLFLLIAAAAAAAAATATASHTTVFTDEKCVKEYQEMSKWECTLWMMSEEPYNAAAAADNRGDRLRQCCDHFMKLSSGCRCYAIWEIRKESPRFGNVPCKLMQECGFDCSTCPGGRAAA